MSATIAVRRGAVYLPASVADTYFAGVAAVIVLIRDGALEILPVRHMAAGGAILKVRNSAGDRMAMALDVFAAHDLADFETDALAASWSTERGALRAALPLM